MSRQKTMTSQSAPADNGEADPLDFPFGDNGQAEPSASPETSADAETTDAVAVPPPSFAPDPFDPIALRLPQDYTTAVGVRRVVLTIPFRRPDNSLWIRAHHDEAYRSMIVGTIKVKEKRDEIYVVASHLCPDLATEPTFRPKLLATVITRQGGLYLWPLNLPGPDGNEDEWTRTGRLALQAAVQGWVRVCANMKTGGYEYLQALATLGEPVWPPDLSFRDILKIALRDRLIETLDHPVLRLLRGEV
jgi:hypothetical protein